MRRIALLLTTAMVVLASTVALAPPALAGGFTVNSTSDAPDSSPGDGKCGTAPPNSVCTLRAAVMEANTRASSIHTNINMSSATYTLTISGSGEDGAATGDLDLKKNISIIGTPGSTTIQGGGSFGDRLFDIPSGLSPAPPVEFNGVTLKNGTAPGSESGGGARDLGGKSLKLTNVTLTNNSAPGGSGGGIYVSTAAGNTFTTNIVTATGNSAGVNGGAFDIEGATNATLQRITATGNSATNGGGLSAFVATGASGVGTFAFQSTFTTNTASSMGGGLYLSKTSGINLVVNNNTADKGGGVALSSSDGPSSIAGRNDIFGNTATSVGGGVYGNACGTSCGLLYNTNIHDNHARDAAGVYVEDGLTLENTSVYVNTATGTTLGGAVYHTGSAPLVMKNVVIDSNSNTGGSSTAGSGFIDDATATDELTNVTISYATGARANGIAVLGSATPPQLKNTIVQSNSGQNCTGSITSLGHNLDSGNTCGLSSAGDLVNIDPKLAKPPAHDAGGFTATLMPNPTSLVVDGGTNSGCPLTDARAVTRPFGGVCDMGAVEITGRTGNSNVQITGLTGSPNPVAKGSDETWTMTVQDTGPMPSFNTVLTDVLPGSVTYKSCNVSAGSCTHVGNTVTVVWAAGLAVNQSVTLTIVATVNTGTSATSVTNSPYVYSDTPDNYPMTNTAAVTVQIS